MLSEKYFGVKIFYKYPRKVENEPTKQRRDWTRSYTFSSVQFRRLNWMHFSDPVPAD